MSHVIMSNRFLRTARCPVGRSMIEYQDLEVPGLVLSVQEVTLKSFALYYRDRDGTMRHQYIGAYPNMPLPFARREAEFYLNEMRHGVFPED